MKVYVDTWIYVTDKFGNMGFIEVYRGILRYETGIYPTIPNFIIRKTPLFAMDFWILTVCSTPFLLHFDFFAERQGELQQNKICRNKHNTLAYSIAYHFSFFNRQKACVSASL